MRQTHRVRNKPRMKKGRISFQTTHVLGDWWPFWKSIFSIIFHQLFFSWSLTCWGKSYSVVRKNLQKQKKKEAKEAKRAWKATHHATSRTFKNKWEMKSISHFWGFGTPENHIQMHPQMERIVGNRPRSSRPAKIHPRGHERTQNNTITPEQLHLPHLRSVFMTEQ